LLLSLQTYANGPKWLTLSGRQFYYPPEKYLLGYAWEEYDRQEEPSDVVQELKKTAAAELTSSVKVTIQTESTFNTEQVDNSLHQYFKESSTSFSRMDLSGLTYETHVDEKERKVHVLAMAEKSSVIKTYSHQLENKVKKIQSHIEMAGALSLEGNSPGAYEKYLKTQPLFREVEEDQTLLIVLGLNDKAKLKINEVQEAKKTVTKALEAIKKSGNRDLSDVCYFMAGNLQKQLNKPDGTVQLAYFTYEDTKMASPFSKRLAASLEQKLIAETSYNLIAPDKGGQKARYILTGTYWDSGNKLKIVANLKEVGSGKALASIEDHVAKSWLTGNGIQFMPENFTDAYARMQAFRKDEIMGGGLQAEVWTNRGNENLIFTENDTLQLYVRVNKPTYIRFIYHLADGSRVLLLDNYYIGKDKVNKVYEIPDKFVCAPPFGVETLQLNAQTKPFGPLNTVEQYGYQFIRDDLKKVIQATRGFKRVEETDLTAETRLVITTMKGD
jgi:hypothetical protein